MAIGDKILRLRKKIMESSEGCQKNRDQCPIIGRYERGEMVPSVEVAKKLAGAFHTTMDYLVDETGQTAEIKDRTILERLMAIERLDQEDKNTIVHVIDSLLRDAKTRKTYAIHTDNMR